MNRLVCSAVLVALMFPSFIACSGIGDGSTGISSIDAKSNGDSNAADQGSEVFDTVDAALPDQGDEPGDNGPADLSDSTNDVPVDSSDPGQDLSDNGPGDVPSVKEPVYRASTVAMKKPAICVKDLSGDCMVDNDMVNAFIAASIADVSNPLNLLFRFTPDIPSDQVVLQVGYGPCVFSGTKPVECSFSVAEPPAVIDGPMWVTCGGGSAGHCFKTLPRKIEMIFMGIFLALHDAVIQGEVASSLADMDGVITGFVPVNTTKSIQVTIPGVAAFMTLYDLISDNPVEELGGIKGYWFEFSFEAAATSVLVSDK